jgi:hypothetical protein
MTTPWLNSSPEPARAPSIETLVHEHETIKILDQRGTLFYDVSSVIACR